MRLTSNCLCMDANYDRCMRRLQSNLGYLASIADRSHKPSAQIPPHPQIMTAPPLQSKQPQSSTSSPTPPTDSFLPADSPGDTLREQYRALQVLFPGVDPKKEVTMQQANANARSQAQGSQYALQVQAQAQAQANAMKQAQQGSEQSQAHSQLQAQNLQQQQKLQNDLMRQKLMQQQAQNMSAVGAAAAQAQAQGQGQGQGQNR